MRHKLLAVLLLPLAACQDTSSGVLAPEAASFVQAPSGPVVNSLLDDGTGCTDAKCTLRDAIAFASPGATITFSVTGTIQLLWNLPWIEKGLTIAGPGAEQLTVRGAGAESVLSLRTDAPVTVSGLTLTGGYEPNAGGGGILGFGGVHLTVENSVLTGNLGGWGGGIVHWGGGALVVRNTTVSNNTAIHRGGGIYSGASRTVIENSTISGNTVEEEGGGGIVADNLTLINSTVSGNSAANSTYGMGGGVDVSGTSTITHSTIWGNSAPAGGGGIINYGTLTLRNTIIANSTSGGDCFNHAYYGATVTDNGYNLVEDGAGHFNSCFSASTSISGDPLLGPLAANGGATRTHALLTGSPAIDAIPFGSNGCGISTDQRGLPRPQPSGGPCDIGAFEVQSPTITLSINSNGTLTNRTGAATITGTVTCSASTSVSLDVTLRQQQQTKGKNATTITVTGSRSIEVPCDGSTSWSVTVTPTSGKFAAGAADATASVVGANPPVQASRTVQLK